MKTKYHKLALAIGRLLDHPTHYRELVGHLIYLTITRPELSYSMHICLKFMQNPNEEHMTAAKRIL